VCLCFCVYVCLCAIGLTRKYCVRAGAEGDNLTWKYCVRAGAEGDIWSAERESRGMDRIVQ
jgi:hypothetical protein